LNIRVLEPADAEAYQALRLAGLQECPSAFAASYAEESGLSIEVVAQRLRQSADGAVIGAFSEARLVGVVGIHRESFQKLAHKANLWGMYVAGPARRARTGRALVGEALSFASRRLGVRQVNLGVNASNTAALRLYQLLGFKQFGLEPGFMLLDGLLHDEIHMVCHLHGET
jgi:ribosomal protein S18 acetylase RimI-like enzyme